MPPMDPEQHPAAKPAANPEEIEAAPELDLSKRKHYHDEVMLEVLERADKQVQYQKQRDVTMDPALRADTWPTNHIQIGIHCPLQLLLEWQEQSSVPRNFTELEQLGEQIPAKDQNELSTDFVSK
ncbi:hypothetical protein UY3_10074 [Chelonia mydas]|uniref:Uncharacterized protein n=1 Tax=Chelonia mydas TaxID=8469 RepID=M7BXI6_CHEMY|nr:hypothetical protein UY3_10074 [Chelonia mydas]